MTDKERLERIIQMQYDGYTIWDMGEDDLVWLIEQAGRVQELETIVDFYQSSLRDADRRVQELENENRILRTIAESNKYIGEQYLEQSERYREALERIKSNVKICGNEEYFPKVVEEIVNEALEGTE